MKKMILVLTALMLTACSTSAEISDESKYSDRLITTETTISETIAEVPETVAEVSDTATEKIIETSLEVSVSEVLIEQNELYITNDSEQIYISEEIFPSQEHIKTAKETAFTDDKIQESIEIDLEDGIITAETADGFRFIQGIHADFDNDGEKESLISLALPARAMGGGSVIYVDGSEAFKLYTDINSSSLLNAYTFDGRRCFSVNGTSGGAYYFTSLFTVENGVPKEKLNYNTIEFEDGIFRCIDKFDSDFTYYIFDEKTGDFIQTEI